MTTQVNLWITGVMTIEIFHHDVEIMKIITKLWIKMSESYHTSTHVCHNYMTTQVNLWVTGVMRIESFRHDVEIIMKIITKLWIKWANHITPPQPPPPHMCVTITCVTSLLWYITLKIETENVSQNRKNDYGRLCSQVPDVHFRFYKHKNHRYMGGNTGDLGVS